MNKRCDITIPIFEGAPPRHSIRVMYDKDLNELGLRGDQFYPKERYHWDCEVCAGPDWKQYDTTQDAPYFGVWVNVKKRMIITYCEGDNTVEMYKNDETFQAEMARMGEVCPLPPAAKALGADGIVEYYEECPFGRTIPEGGRSGGLMSALGGAND